VVGEKRAAREFLQTLIVIFGRWRMVGITFCLSFCSLSSSLMIAFATDATALRPPTNLGAKVVALLLA
jgi:hypothetical protein